MQSGMRLTRTNHRFDRDKEEIEHFSINGVGAQLWVEVLILVFKNADLG